MYPKFRKLRADEIDCRISTINKAYVKLLLYKDARVDQNILDEAVEPMNWQRHHSRDNANCVVAIWDKDKCQWIEKEDTGKESYTEAEKGLASDSFKRACFNWGIGRELYTAPDIQFKRSMANVTEDNKCYDKFYVKHISYDESGCIKELAIVNNNTGVTVFETTNAQETNDVSTLGNKTYDAELQPTKEDAKELCSSSQLNYLKKLVGDKEKEYLAMYKVDSLQKLTKAEASALIGKLK